jgi:hypothetical protein
MRMSLPLRSAHHSGIAGKEGYGKLLIEPVQADARGSPGESLPDDRSEETPEGGRED